MPKKGANKDKKRTNKEIEAERLEQERRLREAKRKEDELKYGINELVDHVNKPMLLTEWFITTCWEHEDPRQFAQEHLMELFTRLKIDKLIKNDEIEMYANAVIYALIFAKDKLAADTRKAYYITNLLFSLYYNGDTRFDIEYPYLRVVREREAAEAEEDAKNKKKDGKKGGKGGDKGGEEEEEQAEEDEDSEFDRSLIEIGDSVAGKTYEDDLAGFKASLGLLAKRVPGLVTKADIARIVGYSIQSYFNNFNLFNYCQTHDQTEENVYLQLAIDEPYIPEPLSSAKYLGKILTPEDIEAERERKYQEMLENDRKAEEARKAAEEAARKEYEEWMGLDPKTVELIKAKLAETRKYMLDRLDEKKKEYEERAANSKAFKKKKK